MMVVVYGVVVHAAIVVREHAVHPGHVEKWLKGVGGAEELGKGRARIAVERVLRVTVVVIVVVGVDAAHATVTSYGDRQKIYK